MNVIHQSNAFIDEGESGVAGGRRIGGGLAGGSSSRRPVKGLMDRLSSDTLFSSVTTVLEAFAKARERINRATEAYEMNLIRNEEEDREKLVDK